MTAQTHSAKTITRTSELVDALLKHPSVALFNDQLIFWLEFSIEIVLKVISITGLKDLRPRIRRFDLFTGF